MNLHTFNFRSTINNETPKMKIRENNSFVNSLHNKSPQTTLAEISQINTGSISK